MAYRTGKAERRWRRIGLLYKRLERGTFRVPQGLAPDATSIPIDAAEMAKILEGINLPPSKQEAKVVALAKRLARISSERDEYRKLWELALTS